MYITLSLIEVDLEHISELTYYFAYKLIPFHKRKYDYIEDF